jgi:CHAT domain-containing protein
LAQFAQADAQLDAAEKMLPLVASQPRNVASLKNARAAVLIEKTTLALEEEPTSPEIFRSLDAAEKSLAQAQSDLDKAGGNEGALAATVHFQHALVHELRGRALETGQKKKEAFAEFQAGMKACEKALAERNRSLPDNHVIVLETRTLRAWLNLRLGDAGAAQKEGLDSLKRYDQTHPKNDIDRGRYLHVLMEAEDRLGNTARARQYADEHRHLVDDGLSSLLAGLSAPEQIQFFRKWDNRALHASMRLSIEHKDDAATLESAVEWLINGKTRLTDVLAAQVQATKAADRTTFVNFQKSVQRQAYLLYSEPTSNSRALQAALLREEIQKREYVEQAAQKFPIHLRWYTLGEVRKSLAGDEVYIGVLSLRLRENAPRHYYAWIVAPQGPVQTVDLGDAERIEALVKLFQREQEKVPFLAPGQERRAEQELRDRCLSELSARVLQPIRQRVNGQKRWVVSPDGPLWNIPWAALLLPETDRYAIEELTFRYAIAGADLVKTRQPVINVGAPLVLGDPWFNYPDANPTHLRKQGLDPLRIPWDRLEYSRQECDTVFAVMQELKLMPSRTPSVMRKEQLSELQAAPRVVFLSTQAFAPLPSKVAVHDPLLSCALAFSGWNYIPPERDALPGMMTGAELLGVDLHGTELAVLASCEAGTEPLVAGQSPANLRHAFHLAGARAVVSALWTIQDKSGLDLMEPFIAQASLPDSDKVAALRNAQQQYIRYLRMYRDHSHPFYWAGFTITGG